MARRRRQSLMQVRSRTKGWQATTRATRLSPGIVALSIRSSVSPANSTMRIPLDLSSLLTCACHTFLDPISGSQRPLTFHVKHPRQTAIRQPIRELDRALRHPNSAARLLSPAPGVVV